jgi:hypothetical protein
MEKYLLLLMKSFLLKALFKHKITMENNNSEHNMGPSAPFPSGEGWRLGHFSPYATLLAGSGKQRISQRIPKNHSHGS